MGKAKRWFKGLLGLKKDKETASDTASSYGGEKRERKKWGFARPEKDSGGSARTPAAWMRAYADRDDDSEEQSKHAIAVAAATAYAADAAFAAAQAAVAVVRLTSQGKGALFAGARENSAAVKIQNVFRGFLARKALKALKGLVKLQALVKGYLVRKRAAATLQSMQALFRAQNAARAQRARSSFNSEHRPEIRARKSIESEFHSKRSYHYDPTALTSLDESPKIVEIDTCGPRSRSRRICMPEYGDDHYYHHAVSSPLPCPGPARLSIPDCDWGYVTEDYKFATAQNTPRFSCSGRAYGPVTPAKSVCGDVYYREYSNNPNYMANTQSFRAKTRSHSAPRHRPELGPKKQLSLDEMMASRSSFSGVRMQRSACPQAEDGF